MCIRDRSIWCEDTARWCVLVPGTSQTLATKGGAQQWRLLIKMFLYDVATRPRNHSMSLSYNFLYKKHFLINTSAIRALLFIRLHSPFSRGGFRAPIVRRTPQKIFGGPLRLSRSNLQYSTIRTRPTPWPLFPFSSVPRWCRSGGRAFEPGCF